MVEIAQRMEDAAKLGWAKSNTSASGNTTSNAGPIHRKSKTHRQSHGKKRDSSSGGSTSASGSLIGNEKLFLQSDIVRGGGLIVHDRIQEKRDWRAWALRDSLCVRCRAKGHIARDCKATANKSELGRVNSMVYQG
jgi:hypothetical protein